MKSYLFTKNTKCPIPNAIGVALINRQLKGKSKKKKKISTLQTCLVERMEKLEDKKYFFSPHLCLVRGSGKVERLKAHPK